VSKEKGKKNFLACFACVFFNSGWNYIAYSHRKPAIDIYYAAKERKGANCLRLGVVMMGNGAHAAACVGVLKELQRRGIEPYAVCGMQAGAWPAALFAAGLDAGNMEKALHQAARLGRKMLAPVWYEYLNRSAPMMPDGVRLNHLLNSQTGQRVLSLCPGAALFLCRMARNGQRVVFSTRAFLQEGGAMLAMQATAGFAARACMALAPFLSPLQYMGSALLGETDVSFACRQLIALGAHRVLVISPCPSPQSVPDALDLACAPLRLAGAQLLPKECSELRVIMPQGVGALAIEKMESCALAGETAARQELDALLREMGMAYCRVLPFRRRLG